ncbi:alpha/beta hydrolase [Nocardiopsis sp. CT-R113]|uniref:Alpha/beta hydrolase n=1 Tax=Nocardiopsis codii TaxID=3065942 RepID=A0ABU7K6Z1_9ACTN|nr:alpha/beta hydrolase [Nocardiopsis sp. CT-R113]MEE2037634.1 alpha/beta hydrolase [Nocardiopsis sp. CT-R113]
MVAVTLLAGSLVAGTPAAADDRGEAPVTGVEWGPCPADVPAGAHALECGTVPVPVDYDDPEGAEIDIMVSRLASTVPGERRGVLMLNPGGPGGSGLSMPADLASLGVPASVLNTYDLIGMDPRGVHHSAPVSCGFTADQGYYGNIPPYAVDEAAVADQAEASAAVADQCAQNDVDGLLPHISTANTARDMDRIRAALGEEKASFFGVSYGSALGAAYASLFPERTDRIVLDSNVGDTYMGYDGIRRFALGFEEAFPDFAAWAAERDGSYGLGDSPEQVEETYFEIAERLDEEPVIGVDGAFFRFGTFVGLYGEANYATTAQLWQALHDHDETAVRRYLDGDGPADGGRTAAELVAADNAWSSFLAVTCNDSEWSEDLTTYRQGVAEDRERYPMYGAAAANVMPCAYWNHEPAEAPVEITGEGPSNVLIVQNLRDAATPHTAGVMLNEKFGRRSRLVSVDGNGHGVYVYGDNPCAWNVTTGFLVDGEFPEQDTSCAASAHSGPHLDSEAERLRDETLERLRETA